MSTKDKAQAKLEELPVKAGQWYTHYKGGKYEVIALALKEDTLEPLIIYRSQEKGTTWGRTYKNWSEKVEHDEKQIARFQKEKA